MLAKSRSLLVLPCLLLFGPVARSADCAHGQDWAGRYDLSTISMRGDTIAVVLYLTPLGEGYWGRVFTTIDAPLPVTMVSGTAEGVDVTARIGGRDLTLHLRVAGDRVEGTRALEGNVAPVQGTVRRGVGSLEPIPCLARGLREPVRCAVFLAAENPAQSGGRRIPLNIVILPSRTAQPAGALFHFAGGPGQAATEQAAGNADRFARIRAQRDIVMIDQRGTGGSNGLYCEFPNPLHRAALLFGKADAAEAAGDCARTLAPRADTRFYHTALAADDVAAVAKWLGYPQIDLYGGSYGTRAALAVLRQHSDIVRTATLRAIMAPTTTLALDNAVETQRLLDRILDECEGQADCHAAFPRLRQETSTLLARLESEPATFRVLDGATQDSVTVPFDRGALAGSLRRLMMDGNLIPRIPLTLHRAAEGDYEVFRTGLERTIGVAGTLAWGMGFSVVCAEDPPLLAHRDVERETAGTFMGSASVRQLEALCRTWPAGSPPPGYDQPVRTDVPVLLLSGELDPATPPHDGDEVARSLTHARHLVMTGVSHGPFPDCALAIMSDFVDAGSLTGLDTSCLANLRRRPYLLRE